MNVFIVWHARSCLLLCTLHSCCGRITLLYNGYSVPEADRPTTAMAWAPGSFSINEMMMMAEFDFQVIHRPWREHGNVDAFSGRPCRQRGLEDRNVVAAVTEGLLKRNPAPHRHKVCIALRVKTLIQLLWGLGYRPMRSHTRWIPMHVIKILEHSCLKHREH